MPTDHDRNAVNGRSAVASSRADVRVTHRFLFQHPQLAAACAVLLLGAGVASIVGLLRWQWVGARYSFTALAFAAAVYCVTRTIAGRTARKDTRRASEVQR